MKFRLQKGERSAKYRPGQFVSTKYAKRYRDKVSRVRAPKAKAKKAPPPPLPEFIEEPEEIEATVFYE